MDEYYGLLVSSSPEAVEAFIQEAETFAEKVTYSNRRLTLVTRTDWGKEVIQYWEVVVGNTLDDFTHQICGFEVEGVRFTDEWSGNGETLNYIMSRIRRVND